MRDFRFRRLQQHRVGGTHDQMHLSYPVPTSPSGKVYQYSPNARAAPRLFLLGEAPTDRTISTENRARIRREPGAGETVCPYSGYIAADRDFVHFEDVEAVKKQIHWEAAADVGDYLANMAKDFNRQQPRKSLVTIKMEYKPSQRPRPLAIREDLLRDLKCDVCQRAYAVYAIALFCPDCGAPNVALHFRREVDLVSEQIAVADRESVGGKAELAYRLMGNAHEDVLTAFETTLKTVYRHLINERVPEQASALASKKEIGNAFQNVERAREKFATIQLDPFASISTDDLEFLRINIQKRHVIGHNLGVADEHYGEITQAEQPGETVAVLGHEIGRFAQICSQLVTDLERQLEPLRGRAADDLAKTPV